MDTFVLFLSLRKCFHLFIVEDDVSYRLVTYGLYYVEVTSHCATFWRVFIIHGCWTLSRAFLNALYLLFNLLIWCITLIDLCILKSTYISGINPTWSWCMILLMHCWILLASILLRIFVSMFISDIGLWFSFLFFVVSLILASEWWCLIEWFWECSFICSFLE